jgi:hypothetical protein
LSIIAGVALRRRARSACSSHGTALSASREAK